PCRGKARKSAYCLVELLLGIRNFFVSESVLRFLVGFPGSLRRLHRSHADSRSLAATNALRNDGVNLHLAETAVRMDHHVAGGVAGQHGAKLAIQQVATVHPSAGHPKL